MRKYKDLDHRDTVKSQEGKKNVSLYQSPRLEENNFTHKNLDYYGIQKLIFSSQEEHHTGATYSQDFDSCVPAASVKDM